tara:strand:+ start:1710 stop:2408 length:699 start_codon:yes stop_codon:yes gene_type:complete
MHVNVGFELASPKTTVTTAVSSPPSKQGEFEGSRAVVTDTGAGGVLSITRFTSSVPIHDGVVSLGAMVTVGHAFGPCVALRLAGAPSYPKGAMSVQPPTVTFRFPEVKYFAKPGPYVNIQVVSHPAVDGNCPEVACTSIGGLKVSARASKPALSYGDVLPQVVSVTTGCVTHLSATTPITSRHLGPTTLFPSHHRDVARITVKVGASLSAVEKHTTAEASASAAVDGAAYKQ